MLYSAGCIFDNFVRTGHCSNMVREVKYKVKTVNRRKSQREKWTTYLIEQYLVQTISQEQVY